MSLKDLTGQYIGKFHVLHRAPDYVAPSGRRYVRWVCQCECGTVKEVNSDALLRGKTVSCGCHSRTLAAKSHTTHGCRKNSTLYGIWCAMKSRCYNPKTDAYKDYGERGIRVCDEWLADFNAFQEWALNNGYDPLAHGHECTIDRKDTNGDYTPENCRWVGSVAQANNRRSNRVYTYLGETHNISEWSKIKGIPYKTLHNRLYTGWSIEKALTT